MRIGRILRRFDVRSIPGRGSHVLPPSGLDSSSRSGALFPRDPGQPLQILRPQATPPEFRRADEHDVVLQQRLCLQLRRDREASDDGELDLVRAHRLERAAGSRQLEVDLDPRVLRVEARQQWREQVGARDTGGGQRERADLALLAAMIVAAVASASASAHNAGHIFLPDGSCLNVGSFKDAPLVGRGAPQDALGELDLEPGQGTVDTSDQYGARYAADQGNTPILPSGCP
jgi:hypothetical protein